MTKKEAIAITGGLSEPSKMPGYGYSLPATACRLGSRLRKIAGSVCSGCYARKGRYVWPSVQRALRRRLRCLTRPRWIEAMTFLIKQLEVPYFRWHDSGDLQSEEHLRRIFAVCRATPGIRHWLPTKERATVAAVLRNTPCPKNLVIRMSAPFRDQRAKPVPGCFGSVVLSKQPELSVHGCAEVGKVFVCPYRKYENTCGPCRACWQRRYKQVGYELH